MSIPQRTIDGSVFKVASENEATAVRCVVDFNEYGQDQIELAPGDVVIDIGAHVGSFSVSMARRFPEAEFFAYEANPENYALLWDNIATNHVRVTAYNLAVWGHDKGVDVIGAGAHGGTIESSQGIVPSVTLDQVLRPFAEVALLKTDCEGAETSFFTACEDDTLRKIRRIVGEYHAQENVQGGAWWDRLQKFFNVSIREHPVFEARRRA